MNGVNGVNGVKGAQEEKDIFGLFLFVVGYLIIREVSKGVKMLSSEKKNGRRNGNVRDYC